MRAADMPPWWEWAFWLDPFSYAVQGLIANEFSAPRWAVTSSAFSSKRHRITLGQTCLNVRAEGLMSACMLARRQHLLLHA